MAEQIVVYVNDEPVKIFEGMNVKHALISFDYALYKAADRGEVRVEDESGFALGLGGTLHSGSRIYTKRTGGEG